jgi:hypothetical protein
VYALLTYGSRQHIKEPPSFLSTLSTVTVIGIMKLKALITKFTVNLLGLLLTEASFGRQKGTHIVLIARVMASGALLASTKLTLITRFVAAAAHGLAKHTTRSTGGWHGTIQDECINAMSMVVL